MTAAPSPSMANLEARHPGGDFANSLATSSRAVNASTLGPARRRGPDREPGPEVLDDTWPHQPDASWSHYVEPE